MDNIMNPLTPLPVCTAYGCFEMSWQSWVVFKGLRCLSAVLLGKACLPQIATASLLLAQCCEGSLGHERGGCGSLQAWFCKASVGIQWEFCEADWDI